MQTLFVYLRCFCAAFLFISFQAVSQDSLQMKSKERHLFLGVGLSRQTLQDPAVSPMIYRGVPIHVSLGYEKRKTNVYSSIELSADFGALSSANATELRPMQSNFYRIDLQYTYLRKTNWLQNTPYTLWLGGQYQWHNSIRITPQNDTGFISFLIANSLKASALLHRNLRFGNKSLPLRYGLNVAVLSHVIRPNYLNIYDYLSPEHDWGQERLEDSKFYSVPNFPNVNSTLAVDYPIRGGNLLRFTYQWDFYHLNTSRRVNYGRNLFLFSFVANI